MRRRVGLAMVGLAVAGASLAWAIPTFAGPAFVEITALVVPIAPSEPGPATIELAARSGVVSRARIEIHVHGAYPLPVQVGFKGPAFGAAIYREGEVGGSPLWQTAAGDPDLEEGDESVEIGLDSMQVAIVEPGWRVVMLPDASGAVEFGAPSTSGATGRYSVVVWAYGIRSRAEALPTP